MRAVDHLISWVYYTGAVSPWFVGVLPLVISTACCYCLCAIIKWGLLIKTHLPVVCLSCCAYVMFKNLFVCCCFCMITLSDKLHEFFFLIFFFYIGNLRSGSSFVHGVIG